MYDQATTFPDGIIGEKRSRTHQRAGMNNAAIS